MSQALHKDIEYYIEPLIFQVEDTLFRVPHEYLAQESTILFDMLQLPQPTDEGSDSEGSVDTKPIVLPQTPASSFRFLLKFLFNAGGDPEDPGLPKEELISLLDLSRKWDMKSIRNKIINHLQSLLENDPARKWNLAKEYEIHDWVRPALERLVRRDKPLGENEFKMLDLDTLLRIADIRESCYPVCWDTDNYSSSYNTSIVRWELRPERGAIAANLDSVTFDCPLPALYPHDDSLETQPRDGDDVRDGEFYFERVVFKLGERFYKVPNQPFAQHSPIFRRRFEKSAFTKYDYQNPFKIESDVSTTDFRNLLRFFFPPPQTTCEPTSEEWASVLRLAARWEMQAVKALAVQKLTEHDFGTPATKLQLAKDLGIQEWFSEGMKTLITRSESLTASECRALDQRYILQILDLRERVHTRYDRYGRNIIHIRDQRGELPGNVNLSDRLAPLLL